MRKYKTQWYKMLKGNKGILLVKWCVEIGDQSILQRVQYLKEI